MDVEREQHYGSSRDGFEKAQPDASLGHLVKEITEDVSTLVRKEVELARNEISQIAKEKAKAAALFIVAGAIGILILPLLLLTTIEILTIWLERWASTLVVTGAMFFLGVAVFLLARTKLRSKTMPEETIATIKEDVEWARRLKK